MLKKLAMAVMACLLAVLVAGPAPAVAQAQPEAVKSTAEVQFPLQMKFNLSARSSASDS